MNDPIPDAVAPVGPPATAVHHFGALAGHVKRIGPGERAALARLVPDQLRPHEIAALARALMQAGLQPDSWQAHTWPRWALIAQGMALAGHDGSGRLGRQLAQAGVAESRVSRLLTARGETFRQLLPRLLRLLASRNVRPNWYELGELVLKESSDAREDLERCEQIRLRIAGSFFGMPASHDAKS